MDSLPWNTELLEFLQKEQQSGRTLILVTGSNQRIGRGGGGASRSSSMRFVRQRREGESFRAVQGPVVGGSVWKEGASIMPGTSAWIWPCGPRRDGRLWSTRARGLREMWSRSVRVGEGDQSRRGPGARVWRRRRCGFHQWAKNLLIFRPAPRARTNGITSPILGAADGWPSWPSASARRAFTCSTTCLTSRRIAIIPRNATAHLPVGSSLCWWG